MNDIELELAAVEELIELQKRKCDLLRAKNNEIHAATFTSDKQDMGDSNSNIDSPQRKSSLITPVTMNPILQTRMLEKPIETEMVGRTSTASYLSAAKDKISTFERRIPDMEYTSPSPSLTRSSPSLTLRNLFKKEEKTRERDQLQLIDALTRFSRLSTDLANERTLLAWVRTALAAARTVVAFLSLSYITQFGKTAKKIIYIGMSILAIGLLSQGVERYRKIKAILALQDPPAYFDRLSTVPAQATLLSLLVLVFVAAVSNSWN